MKIGLDINDIFHGERAVRRYVLNLVREFSTTAWDHAIQLFSLQFRKPAHDWPALSSRMPMEKRTLCLPGGLVERAWRIGDFPPLDWLTGPLDLFHAPGTLIPPKLRIPLLVTVHSVAHLRIPQWLDGSYLKFYEAVMKKMIRRADYWIAVSESMRQDLIQTYSIPKEKIYTVTLGVSRQFLTVPPKIQAQARVKQRWGISVPYGLYVGGLQKNKNIEGILQAFQLFLKRSKRSMEMVLAGPVPPKMNLWLENLKKRYSDLPLRWLNAVDSESDDLVCLYAGAEWFIFPSFWEGWSSPPLEAMACGTPVIASDIEPHRENLQEAAVLVPPHDWDQMAEAIARVTEDAQWANGLRQSGHERARACSWADTARKTLQIYQDILRGAL